MGIGLQYKWDWGAELSWEAGLNDVELHSTCATLTPPCQEEWREDICKIFWSMARDPQTEHVRGHTVECAADAMTDVGEVLVSYD